MPIHFLHQSVQFSELTALYAVSDVCLVSSTRDGMNLVSYEYIATQEERAGALILSEFTGAAQSFNGALVVNPWNTEELANAIHEAVTMDDERRRTNYKKLSNYVNKYTSAWWGENFVGELNKISVATSAKRQSIASVGAATGPRDANGVANDIGDKAKAGAEGIKGAVENLAAQLKGAVVGDEEQKN